MANTWFCTSDKIGVDLGHVDSTAHFALNETVKGNNNSEWMYVYSSAAVGVGAVVGVRASGTATNLDVTIARLGTAIGIAQVAFSASNYGWVATKGRGLTVQTTGATAVGVRLYTSGTAGKLTGTAASTQAQIGDMRLITTASGTSASTAVGVATGLWVVDAAFTV